MQPLLTVVVPSYNVESCLARNLRSLSDPRFQDRLDVLVVDDGSTDGTAAVARDYVNANPRTFRLIRKENGGHGSTVNAALPVARGRYLRIVDADDWVQTEAMAGLLGLLEGTSSDLVVDVKREVNEATGQESVFPLPEDLLRGLPLPLDQVCGRPDVVPHLKIHNLTARTDLLRQSGLHLLEHTFYEDYEYVVKATRVARDVTFTDLQVYDYLVGQASQSVADASFVRRFDDHERVTLEVCRICSEPDPALSEARRAYLALRARLIVETHYKIALVFDDDRARGMARARTFRDLLKRDYPDIYRATHARYLATVALHMAGVGSQDQLDRLLGGRNRK